MKIINVSPEQLVTKCPICSKTILSIEDGQAMEYKCKHVVFQHVTHGTGLYACDKKLTEAGHAFGFDLLEFIKKNLKRCKDVYWMEVYQEGIACGPMSITWNNIAAKDAGIITKKLIKALEKATAKAKKEA